ncbi:MAG: hypothetical protein ACP5N2_04460 [Candidatus Nanoarchaeia archaeon]
MNITIEPHDLLSLVISYHILCAPTEINTKRNQHLFKNLQVSQDEKETYTKLVLSQLPNVNTDDFKPKFISCFNDAKDINDILKAFSDDALLPLFRKNIEEFEAKFKVYFEPIKGKIKLISPQRTQETNENIDTIYDAAMNLTGVEIERPKELYIKIVEGLRPSSLGSPAINGKGNIFTSPYNLNKNWYWNILIHETIAHQTSICARLEHNELFGKYFYEADEGFAYAITQKVIESSSLGVNPNYTNRQDPIIQSYNIFMKNWDKLNNNKHNNNFIEWYRDCLLEFKQTNSVAIPR